VISVESGAPWAGRIAFLGALCLTGVLERFQFGLRFLEGRTWWASNGRDILNGVAFAALTASAWWIGFEPAVAMVNGATVLVLVNALQAALGQRRGATWMSVALAVALGSPTLVAPGAMDRAIQATLELLF
jgi:hypothetical protein